MEITEFVSKTLIVVLTLAFGLWVLSFMLDDNQAMRQCLKDHTFNTCHYQLYR